MKVEKQEIYPERGRCEYNYYCPVCHNKLRFPKQIRYNYCNICGEPLDWTDCNRSDKTK